MIEMSTKRSDKKRKESDGKKRKGRRGGLRIIGEER